MVRYTALHRMLRSILGANRKTVTAQRVAESEFFDAEWYRATQAPDVPLDQAVRHYLRRGAALGLSPGPLFDGPWYLAKYPDVAAESLNPLLHYLDNGRSGTADLSGRRA